MKSARWRARKREKWPASVERRRACLSCAVGVLVDVKIERGEEGEGGITDSGLWREEQCPWGLRARRCFFAATWSVDERLSDAEIRARAKCFVMRCLCRRMEIRQVKAGLGWVVYSGCSQTKVRQCVAEKLRDVLVFARRT
jgi:hypothetical protein